MGKSAFISTGTKWLLFLNTFMAEAIFRQRSYAEKSIDLQVILKMGVWALTFVFCIAFFRLWGKKLLRLDNIFQVVLLALIFISCLYAPNFSYSLASAFSLTAVLFILLLSSVVLSTQEMVRQIILGCSLVIAISLVVYVINPDFGRMKEWHGNNLLIGPRLSGITGTANACGYISAMALLALYYYREYLTRLTVSYWFLVAINVVGLFLSNSRTSMVALLASIMIAGLVKATPPKLAALFLGIAVVIIGMLAVDYHALFSAISRSGEASEITSGTGRTAIWSAVIDLIAQRPLFGWGYASSNTIIPADPNIGFIANHAHNAFLQIALSVGYVGLIVFIALLALKIYFSFRSKEQLNIAFIFFLLIDGLTEPIAFQGPATTTTLVLAMVLALNYRRTNEAPHPPYQQRLS